MATLTTDGRNAQCDGFVDTLDGGTIVFHTSGHVEVATCTFGTPAFGDAAVGVATANAITRDSSVTGGVIAHAHLYDGATDMASLTTTVAGGGGEIILSTLTLGANERLEIDSMTVTQAAS
uniref:Uncharacterized protein n=1 Tax=viral metagenome TaxID=1070528 RepID=A0A6H2A5S8_9ZZZZ